MYTYLIAGAAALCCASAPAAAAAGPPRAKVRCGQTLTHSVRLANDLTDCPADGPLVGADEITIDLDGHTIDGDRTPADGRIDVGVYNVGHPGVTIEDGTVQGSTAAFASSR